MGILAWTGAVCPVWRDWIGNRQSLIPAGGSNPPRKFFKLLATSRWPRPSICFVLIMKRREVDAYLEKGNPSGDINKIFINRIITRFGSLFILALIDDDLIINDNIRRDFLF